MVRAWTILLVATAGCSLVTTQKIPLVLLTEVPVPASARWTDDDDEEIGGDGGGGVLFLNNQADPTEGLFETLESDEAEAAERGSFYYEGTETRTFFSLFVFFFEGVSFDARVVRLRAKSLPAEVASAAPAVPEPRQPPAEVESTAGSAEEPESLGDPVAEPIDTEEPVEAAVEEPKKKKKKKKKKRKKRKRKKRRKP